eukprot:CAMPEP_0195280888 /NCGR_PEP_ID=MMETSP0707-20130614/418_1 /TAXON_ID=33640 /ORGANISM="Asterionellopsis glacialis, Strain CCMP134" /LENGTH=440 /DNA_ID=CAMNT_0040339717 /DNA_START=110 /DNA_END=1432 /DNA_ORIENTATION=+
MATCHAFMVHESPSGRSVNSVNFIRATQTRPSLSSSSSAVWAKKKSVQEEDNDNDDQGVPPVMDPAKKAALDGVLQQIERSYGRGSIMKLGDAEGMNIQCIGTGALTLDAALGGGGYPKGRVVEIYGPESSGKTTLALHAIAECQATGGTAAFVDAEHALDPAYAAGLGADVDSLLVSQPDSGEMALDIVDQLVRSSAVDVIVVDSVAALVPRAELEGDMSDAQIGLQARLMSKAMRKITGSLAMSQCTVIFLNQLRSKVGVIYGSPEVTSGGNALKFYSSVRLDTRRKEILPDNMGIRIKVKVVKNKVAAPFKVVNLDILFGTGIDRIGNILDCAYDLNIVQRKGSWFSYKSENLAQGRHKAVQLLKQDLDLQHQLQTEVRLALADLGNNEEDSNESSSPSAAAKTTNNTNKSQQTSSAATVVESLDGLESSSGPAPFE